MKRALFGVAWRIGYILAIPFGLVIVLIGYAAAVIRGPSDGAA